MKIIEKVAVGAKYVGEGEPVFFIAEMGVNHDNNFNQAIDLIDIAVDAGADAVKLQLFKARHMWPVHSNSYEILKKLETNREWVHKLMTYAEKKGIYLFSSPFDIEAVDLVANLNSVAIKWASSQIYDLRLLRYASRKNIPMILATGACELEDVRRAVDVVQNVGNQRIILMHCVSAYPTHPKDANLRVMDTLKKFGFPVGFSDHTVGIDVPIAAVARGAKIIEKHFTISRKLSGPDHIFAIEPNELKVLINRIRETETYLGSNEKTFVKNVENSEYIVRIFSKEKIFSGQIIRDEMICIKRSNYGLLPHKINSVIGKIAKNDIDSDSPIVSSDF